LLRQFLEEKLSQESSQSLELLVGRAFQYLLERELWDEAFTLISRFELPQMLPQLIKASLQELLAVGRTETLRRWISRGGAPATDPTVGLTAAELAFREGHYYASETLAEVAARSSRCDPYIEACALVVAGRAAHAASREQESLAFYERAKSTAPTAELTRVALMGELVAAIELEVQEAVVLSEVLSSFADLLPQERVVLAGRILNLQTRYALPVNLDAGRAAQQLLHMVDDPVARCSFRNVLGYSLAACGQYEEALILTDEQLTDAERCRLEFVLPYAYCVQALSHAGGRYFAQAEETLRKAEQLAFKAADRAALIISRCLQARVLIAQGAFQEVFVQPPQTHGLMNSLASELLASHALARAGAGDTGRALELATAADQMSGTSETRICVPAARAIVALHMDDRELALTHASEALRTATSTGMIESFVAAYRGCPELLTCLLQDKRAHEDVSHVLALSGDEPINGLSGTHSVLGLSPREKEVLALLGHGLTNAQIAGQLFIGLSTVKVHVRHIFEKLGVKSRTAAALRAVQIGRDYAAPPNATNETSGGTEALRPSPRS
jgi:DNA-binding NarL/FixJ family response regulator